MSQEDRQLEETRAALAQIVALARQVAAADGELLALRNRALEIAALAENLRWSVDPDASDWLLDLYPQPAG